MTSGIVQHKDILNVGNTEGIVITKLIVKFIFC